MKYEAKRYDQIVAPKIKIECVTTKDIVTQEVRGSVKMFTQNAQGCARREPFARRRDLRPPLSTTIHSVMSIKFSRALRYRMRKRGEDEDGEECSTCHRSSLVPLRPATPAAGAPGRAT